MNLYMRGSALFLLFFLLLNTNVRSQDKQFRALLVTLDNGWHHESLNYGVVALKEMAAKQHFDLTYFENPKGFTDKYVEQFQVIIFLHTTGNIFDSAQKKVMERFIQSGKGFVGIHSASDTEYGWEWYTKLVGRSFKTHPAIQTARLKVLDASFPGLKAFDNSLWTDEWYEFTPEKTSGLKYVLAVDESTYKPREPNNMGMGTTHPIAWYHDFDGGRAFYTALGHLPTHFTNQAFLDHLYAGIFYAATGKR
jgi:type 1 glutamine amidotransferase